MTPNDDATAVIDKALDLIETEGWSPNGPHGPNGERCVAVAIATASRDLGLRASFLAAFDRVAALTALTGAPSIGAWNDAPGRDFADVRDLLKRARNAD